jgi:hypothetical protein
MDNVHAPPRRNVVVVDVRMRSEALDEEADIATWAEPDYDMAERTYRASML